MKESSNPTPIIVGLFFFIGLIFLGMYVDGVSTVTALVLLVFVIRFFYRIEKSKNNGLGTLFLVIIFFFAPIVAFIDLRGNSVFNFPVQQVFCGDEESFQKEVKQTQSFGTKKSVNFAFACIGQNEEIKEVSSFAVFAIRWGEYVLIGLILIFFLGIISKNQGGVVNEN